MFCIKGIVIWNNAEVFHLVLGLWVFDVLMNQESYQLSFTPLYPTLTPPGATPAGCGTQTTHILLSFFFGDQAVNNRRWWRSLLQFCRVLTQPAPPLDRPSLLQRGLSEACGIWMSQQCQNWPQQQFCCVTLGTLNQVLVEFLLCF